MRRRVVMTGAGAATALGVGMDALWSGVRGGVCGLKPIAGFDASGLESRIGGEIEGLRAKDWVPKHYRKAVKVMARDIEIAVAAAQDAAASAGLETNASEAVLGGAAPTYDPKRVGCQIGAGLIAADLNELAVAMQASSGEGAFSFKEWGAGGMNNLTPLWMLKYLPNMLACHVTIIHGSKGPSNTITCGEASGALSIGESTRVIERGDADAAFAGGAESKVNPTWLFRLELTGRVAKSEAGADPAALLKPFDRSSAGSLASEGGGIVVLEAEETARARGRAALAEVLGFGAGHSPRSEDPGELSDGLRIAMEAALRDAGTAAGDVDAVVVSGTGVVWQDAMEAHALRSVFGERAGGVELVTLAPMIGNAYAGQGGIAAAVAGRMVAEGVLPARLHGGEPESGLRAGASAERSASLERVLVLGSSSVGQHAALVLGRV